MTDPPKKRRRWPWIVLIVALGLGSGLGCWYWPRGDARFVGQWDFYDKDETEPFGEIALHRHGLGQFTVVGEPLSVSFRWRMIDGWLILGVGAAESENKQMEALSDLLLDWTGHTFLAERETYRFHFLSPDEIRLTDEKNSLEVILKRRQSK